MATRRISSLITRSFSSSFQSVCRGNSSGYAQLLITLNFSLSFFLFLLFGGMHVAVIILMIRTLCFFVLICLCLILGILSCLNLRASESG